MRRVPILAAIACMSLAASCTKAPEPAAQKAATAAAQSSVDRMGEYEGDRQTSSRHSPPPKKANKPVFLFWTAAWCPPCNHVKSTIFTRDEFVAKSRSFVPVYVDGDTPGGQALGKRFNVSGYPTMLRADARRQRSDAARRLGRASEVHAAARVRTFGRRVRAPVARRGARRQAAFRRRLAPACVLLVGEPTINSWFLKKRRLQHC